MTVAERGMTRLSRPDEETHRPRPAGALILAATLPLVSGCRPGADAPPAEPRRSLAEVSPAAWRELAQARLYFGHQSVGAGVMQGVSELAASEPAITLRVVPHEVGVELAPGTLAHSRVGRNGDPVSKIDAFVELVDRGLGDGVDIAFFKFCYVDITAGTDVRGVFESYTTALSGLAKRHPETTFVHSTVPLTWRLGRAAALMRWAKTRVKKLLGRPTPAVFQNANRNCFNAMLRRHYDGREPLFDIARIESTRADGSRCAWGRGEACYAMAREYTGDGGHLNARGRRVVAEQLLILLADLAEQTADGPSA